MITEDELKKLLDPTQVCLLGMLEKTGPMSLQTMARLSFCSTEHLEPILKDLVDRGYLTTKGGKNYHLIE